MSLMTQQIVLIIIFLQTLCINSIKKFDLMVEKVEYLTVPILTNF